MRCAAEFFEKRKGSLQYCGWKFWRDGGVPQKSNFPVPLHLRDPFIDQLPQDIRVIPEDALLYSFIRINHNVR
jgi:hypothetical protein